MYGLLDANVTATYYLARSMKSDRAVERIRNIVDSVRTKGSDHFLYIPNICIAEVFSVLMKYAFGKWNPHVKKSEAGTINKRIYQKLIEQFQDDIHNGRVLYQYELSRYHILAQDLVAPIDHYYQHTRGPKRHVPMGTFDHLYIAMGIHLAHVHGAQKVVLLTADDRIADIVGRCRRGIPENIVRKLKLEIAEEVTGRKVRARAIPALPELEDGDEGGVGEGLRYVAAAGQGTGEGVPVLIMV